jgi:hypothetical protein
LRSLDPLSVVWNYNESAFITSSSARIDFIEKFWVYGC